MLWRHKSFLLCTFLCIFLQGLWAQTFQSNKRQKIIAGHNIVQLDTLSIVPGSLTIEGIAPAQYSVDYVAAKLQWIKNATDSVKISYRVFPNNLGLSASKFDYQTIANNNYLYTEKPVNVNGKKNASTIGGDVFNFGNIQYNGSFGRSISVGNSQSAVLNSQFNLQMNGYIGDSIHLAAALSDNNIPIQPDGTTQQLNQFDQILIQFEKKDWQANIGDINLQRRQNHFLSFYKRIQGLSYEQKWKIGKDVESKTLVSGAIARGQYARNVLTVTDGNQGPYHLYGNNNESNITILAGTERVYIDGVQKQRGQNQDYIIDYNTAQITFTQKTLISTDKRIQVEFEYAVQNYLNSILYVDNTTKIKNKLNLRFAAYQNSDAQNSPINQTLSVDQKQFLADLGDSINYAYYPVAEKDTFSATKVMYAKIDTVVNNVHDSVYVYSTDPTKAVYDLSFVNVGQGYGNYVVLTGNVNGTAYQWVAPVDGKAQGLYEPAEFLVTPKKRQIFTIGTDYQFDKHNLLNLDYAISNYDVNTFSNKDKGNDAGNAGKFIFTHISDFKNGTDTSKHWSTSLTYEWNSANFTTVERLRSLEFARDWGLEILPNQTSEKLFHFNTAIANGKGDLLEYRAETYKRGDGYSAVRNILTHQQNLQNGWHFNELLSLTNMSAPNDKGRFLRPSITISKDLKEFHNMSIGASYLLESNIWHNQQTDTITPLTYQFRTLTAFVKSDPNKRNNWTLSYYNRKDWIQDSTKMAPYTISNNINFTGQIAKNPNRQFSYNVTYRQLSIANAVDTTTVKAEKTLLGRLAYQFNELNGAIVGNTLYELGSGQEQKLVYTYVQVQAGLGQYTWKDYNGDGVAQLNEFEIATFKDQADYIRVFTSSNNYVKADYTQFNYSIGFNPEMLFDEENSKLNKIQKFIARFNLNSSLQINNKVLSDNGIHFNPFIKNIADTSLINTSYVMSNVFSYNRNSPIWGLELTQLKNNNKSLMTYGTESNQLQNYIFKARWNLAKTYTISMEQHVGNKALLTPAFSNRNYNYTISTLKPTFTYIRNSRFRIATSYIRDIKKNKEVYGGEKAISNAINIETKYNSSGTTIISGSFIYNDINYNGDENSTVGYNMLGGLSAGKNLQWNGNITIRFLKNLEFNLDYTGRKPGNTKIIHRGTVTIRAIL